VDFAFDGAYEKQKVRGHALITIRAACLTQIDKGPSKPDKDGLCVYEIEADKLESLTIEPPDFEKYVATATIRDVTGGGKRKIADRVQLQLVMNVVSGAPEQSTLAMQATDDTYGLWFSNNWDGTTTQLSATAPRLQGGTLTLR
jgi:hypothetical protein